MCVSCSSTEKASKTPKAIRVARATKASRVAAMVLKKKVDPYKEKYGAEFIRVRRLGSCAKQRCTNRKNVVYPNYGGRGVEFKFTGVREFTEWVLDNLGVRPTGSHSIDRIDNNGHYEAGNLRWATREEQARNKRAYKRKEIGERIRNIMQSRKDLTYETVRTWIKAGQSDTEILNRRKYARTSI